MKLNTFFCWYTTPFTLGWNQSVLQYFFLCFFFLFLSKRNNLNKYRSHIFFLNESVFMVYKFYPIYATQSDDCLLKWLSRKIQKLRYVLHLVVIFLYIETQGQSCFLYFWDYFTGRMFGSEPCFSLDKALFNKEAIKYYASKQAHLRERLNHTLVHS